MKKLGRLSLLSAVAVLLVGVICLSSSVWAQGGNTGGGGGYNDTKLPEGTVIDDMYNSKYGATWRYDEADSNDITILNNIGINGGHIYGCKDFGGGYYHLGLEYFKNSLYYGTPASAENASHGRNIGLLEVWHLLPEFKGGRAGTNFQKLSDTYGNDEVYKIFVGTYEYAKAHPGYNGNFVERIDEQFNGDVDEAWSHTAWFCANKDGKFESLFDAYSWVSSTAPSEEKQTHDPDSTVTDTVTTNKEKVTVNFKHRLSYNSSAHASATSTYTNATTSWRVQVKQDGRLIKDAVPTPSGSASAPGNTTTTWWSEWLGESSVEVEIPESGRTTVCSTIDYNPKHVEWEFVEDGDWYRQVVPENSDSASSSACITLYRELKEEGDGGQIRFWSTSHVNVPVQNEFDSASDAYADSRNNDTSRVELATFEDHLTVNFDHSIYYNHEGIEQDDIYPNDEMPTNACTKYSVMRLTGGNMYDDENYDGDVVVKTRSGSEFPLDSVDYCINATGHSGGAEVSRTTGYEIKNIKKGETVTVCEKISISPTLVNLKRVGVYRRLIGGGTVEIENPASANLTGLVFDHWKYTTTGNTSGSASSTVCVSVTRPPDPARGVFYNTGALSTYPMFAGETSTVGYNLKVRGSATNRIEQVEVDVFQVTANRAYSGSAVKGNFDSSRSNIAPCTYYINKIGGSYLRGGCSTIYSKSLGGSTGVDITRDTNYPVYVPNMVGDKYCITAGYQMSVWVLRWVGQWPQGGLQWVHLYDYWKDYDAACVPIAKKPTLNLWNGGLFVGGDKNVTTSISKRNDYPEPLKYYAANAASGKAESGRYDHAFGSWVEDLAVVSGNVKNFSSGAQFALGPFNIDMAKDLSPLTIANTGSTMGGSGIDTNSVMIGRLKDYFLSKNVDSMRVSSVDELYKTINSSKILYVNGPVNIDKSIKLNSGTYNTIYDLPQVVIYASDGINIGPDVEQIDAWLITDGTINTCTSFVDRDTAAFVKDGTSTNVTCNNNLMVNGPVFAKNLITNRNYGADGISNEDKNKASEDGNDTRAAAAEIFNLSADTYLWAYAQAGRYASSYNEAYSRELPPRY